MRRLNDRIGNRWIAGLTAAAALTLAPGLGCDHESEAEQKAEEAVEEIEDEIDDAF